ncbi:MAG: AI-2E family transporter [Anaerolineae bacterium]
MPSLPSNSASGTTRWVLIAVVVIALLVAAWFIRGIIMLMLASVILVVLVTMPIRFFMRHGVPRTLATVLSLVLITIAIILLMLAALPTLVQQFATLATVIIPQGIQAIVEQWQSGEIIRQYPFLEFIKTINVDMPTLINTFSGQLAQAAGQFGVSVLPVLGGVADTVLSILIMIFLSIYLLADPDMHQEGIIRLFPLGYRHRAREIFARLDQTLRGWLRATVLSMALVAVATWGGLTLLGIKQAAALGVLAGLMSFIPNFGTIIVLIPTIAVGIVQAPSSWGWIFIVIYGVSFVQSQIATPLIVSGSIRLPPVLVLLGQIVAGAFFGFLGLLLAVPLTAIVMVLVQEIYVKDMLGDRADRSVDAPRAAVDPVVMPDAGMSRVNEV